MDQLDRTDRAKEAAELNKPMEFDMFKFALGGIDPLKASSFVTKHDKLILHEPAYYLNNAIATGMIDPNSPDYPSFLENYNNLYASALTNYETLQRAQPYLDDSYIKEFKPFAEIERPKPNPFLVVDENPYWYYGGLDGNESHPSISNRNRADIRDFHVIEDDNGNEKFIDRPLSKKDRKNPIRGKNVPPESRDAFGRKENQEGHERDKGPGS